MNRLSLLVMVSLLAPAPGLATDDSVKTSAATLTVDSNTRGVRVCVDRTTVGATPLDSVEIQPGTHVLNFIPPYPDNWLVPTVSETVSVASEQRVVRKVNFPAVYHITSDPYGAEVRCNDSLIGKTPVFFPTMRGKGSIVLTKDGYESVEFALTPGGGSMHAVLVSGVGGKTTALRNGEEGKNMTPVYLTSAAAVVGGALAAYFKIKADGYYDEYRATGDDATLQRVRDLDTISGVALVGSEISLLALSYFLFSR